MKRRSPVKFWLALGLAAYALATITGVQTVRQSSERRDLFQRLTASQRTEDSHLREYRMLLLERATLAGYHNVERVAEEELDMRFPTTVVRVER